MTNVLLFGNTFTDGKRAVMCSDIFKHISLHTEIRENKKVTSEIVENTRHLPYTVRSY